MHEYNSGVIDGGRLNRERALILYLAPGEEYTRSGTAPPLHPVPAPLFGRCRRADLTGDVDLLRTLRSFRPPPDGPRARFGDGGVRVRLFAATEERPRESAIA